MKARTPERGASPPRPPLVKSPSKKEVRVGDKYILCRKIGSGSFGQIYSGYSKETGEEVAIKLEDVSQKCPQLLFESRVLRQLSGEIGIPRMLWAGTQGDFNVMIIDLLGPTLEELVSKTPRHRFSLRISLLVADQLISRLECIHNKDYLHRDIKPENFLAGRPPNQNVIYAIDFGLSKKYRDTKSNLHIPYSVHKSLVGTARYASINTHMGVEQSRRDDMESLMYLLIYLQHGSLPWQGLKGHSKKEKYDKIMEKKMNISAESMCGSSAGEFATGLNYCKTLKFEDKPDYAFLRKLFKNRYTYEKFDVLPRTLDWIEEDKMFYRNKKRVESMDLREENKKAIEEEEEEMEIPKEREGAQGIPICSFLKKNDMADINKRNYEMVKLRRFSSMTPIKREMKEIIIRKVEGKGEN